MVLGQWYIGDGNRNDIDTGVLVLGKCVLARMEIIHLLIEIQAGNS